MKKIIKTICIFLIAVAFIPYILTAIVVSAMQESIDNQEPKE